MNAQAIIDATRSFVSQQYTVDSALSYFKNLLDDFDTTIHNPLYSVTWGRDISIRQATFAVESTSFNRSSFAVAGTQSAIGKTWHSAGGGTIQGVDVNGEFIITPLHVGALQASYTEIELMRSQTIGQPLDMQKFEVVRTSYNMQVDEQVYIGDTEKAVTGLVNSAQIPTAGVANGASASPLWVNKTPAEILRDVNDILQAAWDASGNTAVPTDLRLPPAQFGYISTQTISSAGSVSILEYLKNNSLSNTVNGQPLNIQPLKWLAGRGAGGTNRMVAYTNDPRFLRFPMVPIESKPTEYSLLSYITPFVWALGSIEFIYPETVLYRDGI